MKKAIILFFLTLLFFVNSGSTEAKILSKNLVKKAVVEYATKNEFCLLKDPLVVEKILLQPSVIDADGNTPNFGSEISDKDCAPDNNQEIIFGYVRLDFLDSFNSPPGYEQIFLVEDKILRADSFAFDYYKNFNPSQQPHQDVFLGKAIGQKSIRSSSLLLTDPALPEGQKATENSGYILTFKPDGTKDKLFFLYEGKAYLSTKTLKEITDEITLVDYTASLNTSPTPESNAADATANWKTYTGDGFTVKYPQGWFIDEKVNGLNKTYISPLAHLCTTNNCGYGNAVDLEVADKPNNLSTEQFVQQNCNCKPTFTNLTVDGVLAKRTTSIAGLFDGDSVYITKGTKVFIIALLKPIKENPIPVDIFNQILSTFKFTDSQFVDTSTWKTYTGNEYSFKYPNNGSVTSETKYNLVTGNKTSDIIIKPAYQEAPYDKYFEFNLYEEDNPQKLDSKQVVENYIAQVENSGIEGKSAAAKVKTTLKQYSNNSIDGWYAKYGWDYDFVNIVMTKNNKIYTFYMAGDQGVVNDYSLQLLDQVISTFTFAPLSTSKFTQ